VIVFDLFLLSLSALYFQTGSFSQLIDFGEYLGGSLTVNHNLLMESPSDDLDLQLFPDVTSLL
jgi:hypothetical protein